MSRLRRAATVLRALFGTLSTAAEAGAGLAKPALSLESIWQDVRFGARLIRKDPATTAILTLSLGVGLGVCTAVYSLVDALLLRQPAVAAPDRLVQVWSREPERDLGPMSRATYLELRNGSGAFTGLAAFGSAARAFWHDAGGSRAVQLVRQGLIESCLVALLAGAAGAVFASFAVPLLLALAPPSLLLRLDVPVDGRVVAFTAALSLLTGLVLGLGPSLRSAGAASLPSARAVRSRDGAETSRLSSLLLTAQVSTCLTLLIGAGLCARSLRNASSIDPGFSAGRVAMADLDPALAGRSPAQADAFYRDLLRQVRAAPGVRSASVTGYLPLGLDRLVSILYGISPLDAASFLGGTLSLLAGVLVAVYVPARRALDLDPNLVLRSE